MLAPHVIRPNVGYIFRKNLIKSILILRKRILKPYRVFLFVLMSLFLFSVSFFDRAAIIPYAFIFLHVAVKAVILTKYIIYNICYFKYLTEMQPV